MCGGISGALTFGLPQQIRNEHWRLLPFILLYNMGRILSYSVAGAVMAGVGSELLHNISPAYGHLFLQGIAAVVMVAMGLYITGWFPRLALIETVGRPLWRYLEPIGQRLLPVRTPLQAFLFGIVWGWLPCGMVYGALIYTLSADNVLEGALFMALFGLGTLPAVATAGFLASRIAHLARIPTARRIAGMTIVILGLAGPAMSILSGGDDHVHHLHHSNQHSMGSKDGTP